jgi:tRNA threonylcarbamoyladenosine modification (KEOPS) complex Cgi121 subunit
VLKNIEEFRKYVAITGFRNVKIKDVEEFFKVIHKEKPSGVEIQFFDAKLVATWQHLYFAVLNALTAFKNGENISKSIAMEIMIYASAQRQIRKSIEFLGIKPNTSSIAVLVIGEKPEKVKSTLLIVSKHIKARMDDAVLELSKEKTALIQKAFGISDIEIKTMVKENNLDKALLDLVIERMALLTTKR